MIDGNCYRAAPLCWIARAGDTKAGFLSHLDEHASLPRAFFANRCDANFINDLIATLSGVECRDGWRAMQEARDVRRISKRGIKSKWIFVGHPACGLWLKLCDQIRAHIKIAGARTTAEPLNRTAGSEIYLQVFNIKRNGARRLIDIEYSHRTHLSRAFRDGFCEIGRAHV